MSVGLFVQVFVLLFIVSLFVLVLLCFPSVILVVGVVLNSMDYTIAFVLISLQRHAQTVLSLERVLASPSVYSSLR